ncbi:hypothetical protein [Marinomonas sp. THO17]|uniref:hypothetical protein n=1 Tax=Marinomonas sp. THO17 TaxID=3149048 RepID=UPI00336C2EE0
MKPAFTRNTILLLLLFPLAIHANPLIRYGQSCLIEEQQLNEVAFKIQNHQQNFLQSQQVRLKLKQQLEQLNIQLTQLNTGMEDCETDTPNSQYCHRTREQYQRLNQRIDEVKQSIQDQEATQSAYQYELDRKDYENKRQKFKQRCYRSNQHYAFIQDSEAYSQVCHSEALKKTQTCSFL